MEEKTERGLRPAVIVTGGDCDTEALAASGAFMDMVRRGYVIAADSGLETAERLGLEPELIVGDFDSYTGALPAGEDAPEILRVPAEKDVTDTVLACGTAMERGYRRLILVGGTGGRADHYLANILWLWSLKNRGIDAFLTDGRNEFRVLRDEEAVIPRDEIPGGDGGPGDGWYFSLFALGFAAGEKCSVTAEGCRYPLPEPAALGWDNPSYAVSNEVTAERAVIRVRGTVLLIRSRRKPFSQPEPGAHTLA